YRQKSFSCEQAAEILGISVSTFYRMRQRYEHNDLDGLADKRGGKISAKRAGVDELMRIINRLQTLPYEELQERDVSPQTLSFERVFFPDRFPCLSDTDHHQCLF
ncbi:MAG: hypothetical protein CSA18_04740, partial [Deltaproteobacteria bacterium]